MFTGIIEEIGRVRSLRKQAGSAILGIEARLVAPELNPGDSIAVNGACLTVTAREKGGFSCDLSPETIQRTTLGAARKGMAVNLERPLSLGSRLGGHFVQGHVDGVGRLVSRAPGGDGWAVTIEAIAAKIGIIQSQMTSSPCSISQKAALEALNRPDAEMAPMLKAFQQRRDRALALVNEIPEVKCHPPEGAFYLFLDVSAYLLTKNPRQESPPRTLALARYLILQHKVAIIPGCAFGSDDHIRISFATSIDKIEEGIRRVGEGLEGFRKLSHEERGVFERPIQD